MDSHMNVLICMVLFLEIKYANKFLLVDYSDCLPTPDLFESTELIFVTIWFHLARTMTLLGSGAN